jgi:glycerol-3-phosphate dehydrogenase (NAD(P)+)
MSARIAVLGGGAWGTALAVLLSSAGHRVGWWVRRPEQAQQLLAMRENREYLPGVALPGSLQPTADGAVAMDGVDWALVAIPSRALAETLTGLPRAPAYISATKGLAYLEGLETMSTRIARVTGVKAVGALSGPNLAEEVARFLPAAAVVATDQPALALQVQQALSGPSFRVYTSPDRLGVELGGALKNVMALAAGISDGLRLGDNCRATLITRGLREMVRLGVALGAQVETFYGMSGLGDLVATCTSLHSRNRAAGEQLARGVDLATLEARKQVAEGLYTVRAMHTWAQQMGQDLPLTEAVYRVVYGGSSPAQELGRLMGREARAE